jgi:dATP/dGTP diphosphohydrolase
MTTPKSNQPSLEEFLDAQLLCCAPVNDNMINRAFGACPEAEDAAPSIDVTLDSVREAAPLPLPVDSRARKEIPMCSGLVDYFSAALAAVAHVSFVGNEKHNPGQPLHHARGKSMDHADCIVRHLVERGTVDPDDGQRHSAKLAWRALALLQEELEAAGAQKARGAR